MKIILKTIAFLYSSLLFYIFFLARRRPSPTLFLHKTEINLIPLKNKVEYFLVNHNATLADKIVFYADLFGNIILFVPLPIFLFGIFNVKKPWKIIFIAFAISTCVELTQFVLSIGVADIDDVILNTIGSITGIQIFSLFKKQFPQTYHAFFKEK